MRIGDKSITALPEIGGLDHPVVNLFCGQRQACSSLVLLDKPQQ
jgi:hypothetical protein